MLGGLYGDLPPPSQSSSSLSSLSSSSAATAAAAAAAAEEVGVPAAATDDVKWPAIRMTPPTMLRKAGIFAAPPSVLRHQSAAAAAAKPKVPVSKPATTVSRWAEPEKASPPPQAAPPVVPQQPALVGASACVVEEYDPARPNDYEEYCRERRRRKMEEEMKRDIDRRRQEDEEKEREREVARQRELEKQRDNQREAHISGEEAWKRRGMLSSAGGRISAETAAVARSPSPPPANGELSFSKQSNGGHQMTAAQRMMARMGWKEGQGLGKQEQGITTPLMAKKTDKRAGVIVNAGELKKQKAAIVTPTRVILLRNMVGPGEVDVELQDEVASECSKYGVVTSVLIYEIIEQDYSPTEAVRIFVQFERAEQASKALADLDGRFFGGRVVKGTFYDEDRFARNELAPLPGEAPVNA